MSTEKYSWVIQKSLFELTNQDSTFSHTHQKSKMFNVTSKYSSFFNNKLSVSWIAHVTRDFLTFYSCWLYSSMLHLTSMTLNSPSKTTLTSGVAPKIAFSELNKTTLFNYSFVPLCITFIMFYCNWFVITPLNCMILLDFCFSLPWIILCASVLKPFDVFEALLPSLVHNDAVTVFLQYLNQSGSLAWFLVLDSIETT